MAPATYPPTHRVLIVLHTALATKIRQLTVTIVVAKVTDLEQSAILFTTRPAETSVTQTHNVVKDIATYFSKSVNALLVGMETGVI